VDVAPPQLFSLNGAPVMVAPEERAAGWEVQVYVGVPGGSGWELVPDGDPVGTRAFNAALRGHTLFLATSEGGIRLRHLDLDQDPGIWVDDPGPYPGTASLSDPACAVDSPGVASGLDGLWVSWSGACTQPTTWDTYLVRME
jgi:hypothetical protein